MSTHPADDADAVKALIPKTGAVLAALKRGDFGAEDRKKARALLASDFGDVNRKFSDAKSGKIPSGADPAGYRAQLQRARLAIFEAELLLDALQVHEEGADTAVIVAIIKAVSSAQTGSGEAYKALASARARGNTPEVLEIDLAARFLALDEMAPANDKERLRAAAAKMMGKSRSALRAYVADFDRGQTRGPVRNNLYLVWREALRPLVESGADVVELLHNPPLV